METSILTALEAVLATIVLVAAVALLRRLFHRLHRQLNAWHGSDDVRAGVLLKAPRAAAMLRVLASLTRIALTLALLIGYTIFMFGLFPSTKPHAASLLGYTLSALRTSTRAIAVHLPDAGLLIGVLVVTYVLIKVARFVFSALGKETITVPGFFPDWAEPTYKIVRGLLIALAAVVLFHYLPGSNSPAFEGVSLFLGFLFSLDRPAPSRISWPASCSRTRGRFRSAIAC